VCDCYECKIRGATSASESADALAREVKRLAIAQLDERRLEFYRSRITDSGNAMGILEDEGYTVGKILDLDLESLMSLVFERQDIREALWQDDDDNYHEGYEHGAEMVLRHLHELFGITP